MTRIIAGRVGGRRLAVPRGERTRPTSDRVREALFSRLEALGAVAGARVLDLYAGSGALGLEAVSRGAASATLVEADRRAVAVARANATSLGLPGVHVVTAPALRWLTSAVVRGEAVDLVLLDPPYDVPARELDAVLRAVTDVLAPDGVVAVERAARDGEPSWPPGLVPLGGRRSGETTVWLAAGTPTDPDASP